jgi:hypothetical protein
MLHRVKLIEHGADHILHGAELTLQGADLFVLGADLIILEADRFLRWLASIYQMDVIRRQTCILARVFSKGRLAWIFSRSGDRSFETRAWY